MIALFVLGCAMQHVRSLMLDQESSLCSLQGNHGVLTTGPPGKCHGCIYEHILQNMSSDYIMCIFPNVTTYCKLLLNILL